MLRVSGWGSSGGGGFFLFLRRLNRNNRRMISRTKVATPASTIPVIAPSFIEGSLFRGPSVVSIVVVFGIVVVVSVVAVVVVSVCVDAIALVGLSVDVELDGELLGVEVILDHLVLPMVFHACGFQLCCMKSVQCTADHCKFSLLFCCPVVQGSVVHQFFCSLQVLQPT